MADAVVKPDGISFKEFLETVPPGRAATLAPSNVHPVVDNYRNTSLQLQLSPILLHCGTSTCAGTLFFEPSQTHVNLADGTRDVFLTYSCRNCKASWRTFAIRLTTGNGSYRAQKFGEMPQFGPPLAAKLLQLAGADGEILRKGRQSENQSLGIGAFAYYRRVVERQKSRLIDDLRSAVERLGGDPDTLSALESARTETRFAKAIELIAAVMPKELYVGGQNPLTLLHGPLSIGLHALSDDECLSMAHNIRIVLSALLERIQLVTEEKAELDAAIKGLLKFPGKSVSASDDPNL